MNENNGFEFEDISSSSKDDYKDISSRSKDEYEDIISDSRRTEVADKNGFFTFEEISSMGKYRKKKRKKKAIIISLVSVIVVLAVIAGVILSNFKYNYNEITEDHEELGVDDVIDDKIINVALFGLDTRNTNTFKGNSDSIMILSLNTITKKVKIFSVMRDSLVPIENNGKTTYNKINSAYANGGPELAIKTLNQNFNLDITEYATVNFFGMVDIIDAVGGIDATITEDELYLTRDYSINACISEMCGILNLKYSDYRITSTGTQHLNGLQAVAYSRVRHGKNVWGTNDDYGRTDRQRYVMEQLFNKALSLKKTEYVKLVKALIPCSETSLSVKDIITLANSILLKSPTFEQYRIPENSGDNKYVMPSPQGSFGSVVYYDLSFASDIIHAVIYDDMTVESYIEANGIRKNDWYSQRY